MSGRKRQDRLPERVLSELAAIALTRATDVVSIENGVIELKPQMKKKNGAAIASVERSTGGLKIKFYDKLKALELLGSYLGLFGSVRREEEQTNLIEAIMASTGEAIDTSDIQELQQAAAAGDDLVEPS